MIGIRPEKVADYERLHAAVWPGVLDMISKCNIRDYTISLREPEDLLFGCWEYHGKGLAADSARMAADPVTQEWRTHCGSFQVPFETRKEVEGWALVQGVFHHD